MKDDHLKSTVLAAMFAALIFLGTFLIRIPIPATNGYIHFGDGFIYVASAILPVPFAAAAAAIGGFCPICWRAIWSTPRGRPSSRR